MTHYSLRKINPDETIIQFYECEYRNALDALDAAQCLSTDGTIEVWSDSVRIASINKGGSCSMSEGGPANPSLGQIGSPP